MLELLKFLFTELEKGHIVTAGRLRDHLLSDNRLHPFCQLDVLPPCDIHVSVIKKAMQTCCHTTWAKINPKGKKNGDLSDENKEKSIFMNWWNVRESLLDMARTADKFFPALKKSGDYHANFDTHTYFKWNVAVELTYPEFCKHLQVLKDAGTLDPPSAHDFWDKENEKPARKLINIIDNAPYHQALQVQLSNKSKKDYAMYLRGLGVTQIKFKREDKEFNVEVPDVDKDWQVGFPTAAELREITLQLILSKKPELVKPPYAILMDSKKDGVWGKGPVGWQTVNSAAYVSSCDQVCVEFKWSDGKNHAARHAHELNNSGRNVINCIRDRWYSNVTKCKDLFRHCEDEMNRVINEDHKENGGPMSGTIPDLVGLPDADTLALWKERAGMGTYYYDISEETNDQMFADASDDEDD
jgi:hypothetical protein